MSEQVLFHEEQRFRQPWLWLLLLASMLPVLGGVGCEIYRQVTSTGGRSAPGRGAQSVGPVAALISAGVLALLYFARLITEVRQDGLYLRFVPFHASFHRIAWEELQGWEPVTYRPILDYGGWGIRYGRRGRAYNVSGNRGVQLHLANGKRLLLGSQRPEELATALDRAAGPNPALPRNNLPGQPGGSTTRPPGAA